MQRRTRTVFKLTGTPKEVNNVLKHIAFKGVTVLPNDNVTPEDIQEVFSHNKSAVCTNCPPMPIAPIQITVVNNNISASAKYCIDISLGDIAGQFKSIANLLNCDIGDHQSNSSGLTGRPTKENCVYCQHLNGHNKFPARIIYNSANYFVLTGLGGFIPGYWLIIPYKHVMSNAAVDFSTQQELLEVIEDMKYLLHLTYGKCTYLVWENGTGNSGRGKAGDSIVHAHTQIVLTTLTPKKIIKILGVPFDKISTEDLSNYKEHSYLLLQDQDSANMWYIHSNPDDYVPRQAVRTYLANEHGIPGDQWNWRTHPFTHELERTYLDMATAIQKNWHNLPNRIQERTSKYV